MSVQRGYYQVPSTKVGRVVSSKGTKTFNSRSPLTAVYTNGTLASSAPRVAYTKPYTQPKIMSPANPCPTQRKKYVTSLSIIPKDKVPKVVVLPSIDKDIAASSGRSPSAKIPVVATENKSIREAPKSAKESHPKAKYVSCLHTSLSTEWMKDSFDREIPREEKGHRTSSLQIELCNKLKANTARAITSKTLLSPVSDKADSKVRPFRGEADHVKGVSSHSKNCKENTDMDKQIVRIQYLPVTGRSFTIKDATSVESKRAGPSSNVISPRGPDHARPGLRPRMLPKSRFRVKIQKCHHKSVNISDSFNQCSGRISENNLSRASSVVVQDRSPQRSFSVQRHVF